MEKKVLETPVVFGNLELTAIVLLHSMGISLIRWCQLCHGHFDGTKAILSDLHYNLMAITDSDFMFPILSQKTGVQSLLCTI